MSFLKKAVKPATGGTKPVPKPGVNKAVNPLGTPKKPIMPPTMKKEEGTTTAPKKPVPPAGVKKPNPLGKPAVKKEETKVEDPTNIEELGAKEVNLGINNTEEPKVEKEPEVKEEKKTKKEIAKEEPKEEVKEESKKEKAEEPVEEKKTAKKSTSKKSTKKKEEGSTETVAKKMIDLPKVDINRIEDYMYPVVLPTIEAWENEKEEVNDVIAALEIEADMNPATAKVLLADMATAYGELNKKLTHYKTQYENLTGKDGIIECVKAIHGQGKNAEERKFAATEACMNYVKPGEKEAANLFEYEYMIRERYYFYDNIMKELEFKRQLLITFNGMLNAESRI